MLSRQLLCGRQDEGPERRTQKQEVKVKVQLYCWEKLHIRNKHLQKPKQTSNAKLETKLGTGTWEKETGATQPRTAS